MSFIPPELARLFAEIDRELEARARLAESADDPRSAAAMLTCIFSATQLRLYARLFGQPDRAFHLKELVRASGCGVGPAHRELSRLEAAGLLASDRDRGRKRFRAQAAASIHAELCALFRKYMAGSLREAIEPLGAEIEAAFICAPTPHCNPGLPPLPLVLIASRWPPGLDAAMVEAQGRLDRQIEAIVLPADSFRDGGYFVESLLARTRAWVKGNEAALAALRHDRP